MGNPEWESLVESGAPHVLDVDNIERPIQFDCSRGEGAWPMSVVLVSQKEAGKPRQSTCSSLNHLLSKVLERERLTESCRLLTLISSVGSPQPHKHSRRKQRTPIARVSGV